MKGSGEPLLLMVILAVCRPAAEGVNVTVKVIDAPASRLMLEVPLEMPKIGFELVMPVMVMEVPLVLRTVKVRVSAPMETSGVVDHVPKSVKSFMEGEVSLLAMGVLLPRTPTASTT